MIISISYLLTISYSLYLKLVLNNAVYFQAEIELNLQKRRGHGVLSVLGPKFSGVLGEALDIAARWSGDVVSPKHMSASLYYSINFYY